MKTWSVSIAVDATMTVVVEAETAEEAKETAMAKAYSPGLCHQCSDGRGYALVPLESEMEKRERMQRERAEKAEEKVLMLSELLAGRTA